MTNSPPVNPVQTEEPAHYLVRAGLHPEEIPPGRTFRSFTASDIAPIMSDILAQIKQGLYGEVMFAHEYPRKLNDLLGIRLNSVGFKITGIETADESIFLNIEPSGPRAQDTLRIMNNKREDYYFGLRGFVGKGSEPELKLTHCITWDLVPISVDVG